ncbi:MAG: hypothetical protein OIF48_05665 [Silicimonas sp.]|nr:hypothetical protein [Silicimonas sp.]
MESSDAGFPGFVAKLLRHLMAFCVTCVPVGILAAWANENWAPEFGISIFAVPLVIVGSFLPYAAVRTISRVAGLDSYVTALAGGAFTGGAALSLVGTGKGDRYAVYVIDLSIWFLAGLGALAGALCYWLELKFGAREIGL